MIEWVKFVHLYLQVGKVSPVCASALLASGAAVGAATVVAAIPTLISLLGFSGAYACTECYEFQLNRRRQYVF